MRDAEIQAAAFLEHAMKLVSGASKIRAVHERHRRNDGVKTFIAERSEVAVGREPIFDAERLLRLLFLCGLNKTGRKVDAGHARAAAGEQPRVVPLAAAGIEDLKPRQVRDECEKHRIVADFPKPVLPGTDLLGPKLGIVVPEPRDLGFM